MTETVSKPLMTRRQLGAHLRSNGFPFGNSTLAKLCAPAIGDGPPVAAWLGNRALHDPDVALDWARSRLRSEPRNLATHQRAGPSSPETMGLLSLPYGPSVAQGRAGAWADFATGDKGGDIAKPAALARSHTPRRSKT
jgi:hypothetical protein